jgi:hypothetical protein
VGPIFAVMPWNVPFCQLLRFFNTTAKTNVPECDSAGVGIYHDVRSTHPEIRSGTDQTYDSCPDYLVSNSSHFLSSWTARIRNFASASDSDPWCTGGKSLIPRLFRALAPRFVQCDRVAKSRTTDGQIYFSLKPNYCVYD